jgi:hypothetical protein
LIQILALDLSFPDRAHLTEKMRNPQTGRGDWGWEQNVVFQIAATRDRQFAVGNSTARRKFCRLCDDNRYEFRHFWRSLCRKSLILK